MNDKAGPTTPARQWRRGQPSNYVSRSTQHRWMWEFIDRWGPELQTSEKEDGMTVSAQPAARCLDWDGVYGASVVRRA